MTTALTFIERVAREISGYISCTASDTGEAAKNTFVSDELRDYASADLANKYIKLTGIGASTDTDSVLEARRIKNYISATGTIMPYREFTTQQTPGITAIITDLDPADILYFVNESMRQTYPYFVDQVRNTELVAGNILPNPSFEEGTAAPTGWTASTATAVQSTTALFGTYSCSLTVAAGYVYISSDDYPDLLRLAGADVDLYCWVKTDTAANARIAVYTLTKGGTAATTYSTEGGLIGYHTGDDEWELLKIPSVSIPPMTNPSAATDLAEVQIRLVTTTTDTAYFDNIFLPFSTSEYKLPAALDTVKQVYSCNDWMQHGITRRYQLDFEVIDKAGTKYLYLPNGYEGGKRLELVGSTTYTDLSADSDAWTIPSEWNRVIVNGATALAMESMANQLSSVDREDMLKNAARYRQMYEVGKLQHSNSVGNKRLRKVV